MGSYRDEKEADAFRARMIMMGFNVQIQKARVNNMDVNRVRIGPFDSEKELSESRAQLSGAKINSTIVR
ncbi:SPOR domain-containing protein [Advenella kashmirensis]|uniref:SPOR domain-containing protein n=1 Tax=Advenella kashmirensis TaxID=310575 RepID=UPI001494B217|nr:SPOR domain-containing protein [Advenella kashmirensis]